MGSGTDNILKYFRGGGGGAFRLKFAVLFPLPFMFANYMLTKYSIFDALQGIEES